MRFQFIFNMVIILLILIPITVGTDDKNDCISELQLYLQFQSFDKEEISSLSDYQHPEYCEGDLLRIKSIIIKNDANCSSKPQKIYAQFQTPKRVINNIFCMNGIRIPSIEAKQTYTIKYQGYNQQNHHRYIYRDSLGQDLNLCAVRLDDVGIWELKDIDLRMPNSVLSNIKSASLLDLNNHANEFRFKVRDKESIVSIELQESTRRLAIVAILVAVVVGLFTIFMQCKLTNWQIKEQKRIVNVRQISILQSIRSFIGRIRADCEGQLKELKKSENNLPSYDIIEIPVKEYVLHLDTKLFRKSTEHLKDVMIKVFQKIQNINNVIYLERRNIKTDLRNNNYKYHKDLKKRLKNLEEELKKFITNK